MADTFPTIEEFAKLYGYALDDPKLVQAYDDYDSSVREYKTREKYFERLRQEGRELGREEGRAEGREVGRAEGRTEGREQERAELLERMRKLGVSEEVIAQL